MYVEWTKHLKDPENAERFTKEVYSARSVLERLYDILTEKEQSLDRSETNMSVYDNPNWEFRQAHKNGRREELSSLKTLINLDQQKDTKSK